MRYLDPKNDLVFKKVFGGHANILMSFLNATLPLDEGRIIQSIEYLPPELVPEIPSIKNSIVDVRCLDNNGRHFIVEMQMLWTDSFKKRVLFNASKVYVRQLDRGIEYKGLQPVYAISIVNEIFEPDRKDEYYHHYILSDTKDITKKIDDIQLIFLELPKFKAQNIQDKKLIVLWLRYFSEIENGQEMLDKELLDALNSVPEIAQALELTKESGYTKAELEAYDKYWDNIRTERTLIADAEARGKIEGEQIGIQKGEQIGVLKGKFAEKIEMILSLNEDKLPIPQIAKYVRLPEDEVIKILKEKGKLS
jgi:predicted transposase/invertase (TIGR01784 family)